MRHILKTALFAATTLAALPAHAQQETIVVTATRVPTQAERLPADVDVIDAAEAQSRGLASIADALADAPGLDVVSTGGFGQQTSLFSGGANSNHTLVLFDAIRLNDPSTPGSSFDAGQDTLGGLARIEVVQGPMSAVFGSDAIGGVVNMLPRHGGEGALHARLDFASGSFDTLNASAGVDGTLGGLRYAVTAEGYAGGGYDIVPERMSTHAGDEDGAQSATLTGVFDLDVSPSLALDLLVRARQAQADFDAFAFAPPTFAEQRVDDPDLEIAKNDLAVARLGATWRITDALSLRASGGGLRQDREERDGAFVTSSYEGDRDFADLTLDWRAGSLGAFSNAALLAGVETQTERVDVDQGFAAITAEQDHRGAFLTAQGDLARLTLTAAARVDNFEGFGEQATWRLGASYNLFDAGRIYAAYGTSFRAPTLYERFISFGNPNLDPETSKAWEIGADTWLAAFGQERGVELGLVYRSQDIDGLIDFGPSFTYVNIKEAEIESAEARIALKPFDWLTARVSYVYTDARDGVTGAPLLRRPEGAWTASLNVEHGPFSARLSWRQVGERADQLYGDDGFGQGVGVTPAYDVLRASVGWDIADGVQAYIAGDNLSDEAYEPANGFAGAPRSVRIGVRLKR